MTSWLRYPARSEHDRAVVPLVSCQVSPCSSLYILSVWDCDTTLPGLPQCKQLARTRVFRTEPKSSEGLVRRTSFQASIKRNVSLSRALRGLVCDGHLSGVNRPRLGYAVDNTKLSSKGQNRTRWRRQAPKPGYPHHSSPQPHKAEDDATFNPTRLRNVARFPVIPNRYEQVNISGHLRPSSTLEMQDVFCGARSRLTSAIPHRSCRHQIELFKLLTSCTTLNCVQILVTSTSPQSLDDRRIPSRIATTPRGPC